ncbi:metal-sensitive transcriptional regulator [Rothia terrae]|uniref:metal-sensitive transcriptional regulator n=1 Tax=Rothia terrae TaxID=396015 RepID=UPI0028819D88|nr:metal-sensitive transcriptional regulator [Rothia terrae]MDT0189226.1 metal-sensitive transcriptional regulator [Rothia terrae]
MSETHNGCEHGPHGYSDNKDAYLKRLRRIEGQVRGIERMVQEDKYCIDILTQVAAINKALHAVSTELLEEHLRHCVVDAAQESARTGDPAAVDGKIAEATAAISRMMRS